MANSYTNVWIHLTFSTKNRMGVFTGAFASELHNHIQNYWQEMGCPYSLVNGHLDHIRIVFLMPADESLTEIVRKVKGESSHWVNSGSFLNDKFAWQSGYAAFSVSESNVDQVKTYIHNQAKHHATLTWQEEIQELLKRHGLQEGSR